MKNMKYQLSIALMLSFLSIACESEKIDLVEKKQPISLLDIYRGFTSPDRAASVSVINYQANFISEIKEEQTTATVTCVPENSICEYEEIIFGNHSFDFAPGSKRYEGLEYKSIFGSDISLTLQNNTGIDNRDPEMLNLYIPMILDVSINEVPNLQNGYNISWNADTQNTAGVYIILEYTPHENPDLKSTFSDNIFNYVNIEDTGVYNFSKSDFPDIPSSSLVMLRIIRGAFELPEIEGELVRVYGLTHVGGYARIQ